MSTHADAATAALHAALDLAAVWRAVRDLEAVQQAHSAADDVLDVMRLQAGCILALEALTKTAGHAEERARASLAETMSDTGATAIEGTGYLVSLRDCPRSVIVIDESAIPREFWSTPAPKPDRKLLAKALAKGTVPGATFSNRPPPIISISTRKAA